MAKDPAVLFYYQDFLVGTSFMSNEEIGVYIKILCHLYDKDTLTEKQMINVCSSDVLWNSIKKKFLQDPDGKYYNQRAREEKLKRVKYSESRRNSRLTKDEDQVKIYLMLDKKTSLIKIGSSVNPLRRLAEMKNQLKPAITVGERDYELIFISDVCERSIESELHNLYSNKRVTGEWFNLKEEDIENIKQTLFRRLTSVKRMENENEDEDINVNSNDKKVRAIFVRTWNWNPPTKYLMKVCVDLYEKYGAETLTKAAEISSEYGKRSNTKYLTGVCEGLTKKKQIDEIKNREQRVAAIKEEEKRVAWDPETSQIFKDIFSKIKTTSEVVNKPSNKDQQIRNKQFQDAVEKGEIK